MQRIGANAFASLCLLSFQALAQVPTEDEIWGYRTTATGTEYFDSLPQAESALRAIDAAHAVLSSAGIYSASQEEIRIRYQAEEPELPPILTEAAYFTKESTAGQAQGPFLTYEEAVAVWVGGDCGASRYIVPITDWIPFTTVLGAGQLYDFYPTVAGGGLPYCWSAPAPNRVVEITWQAQDVTCPSGYVFDETAAVCRNDVVEEIVVRRLTEEDDCIVGNPCYVSTGAKVESEVDYEGAGIAFERYYRSRYADYPSPVYPLGPGWTHNYAARVVVDPDSGNPISLFRPSGRLVLLDEGNTPGEWFAGDSSMLQLRPDANTWVVYVSTGAVETYDMSGRLLTVRDGAGRTTTLAYGTNGQLQTVTGPFGHRLTFRWGTVTSLYGAPRYFIRSVTDPAGNALTFSYTGSLLTEVQYQDQSTKSYLYEDPTFPAYLTGVVDENQIRYKTFAYDSRGRATLTEHAGGLQRWSLSYNADNTVTATDSRSLDSLYSFQSGVSAGRAIGDISRSGFALARVNEASGQHRLLSHTDQQGIVTVYEYDAYHLLSMTEAAGATDVTPRTTTYSYLNNTSQLLTEERMPSVCVDGTQRQKSIAAGYVSGTQLVSERTESGWVNQSGSCVPISRVTTYQYGSAGSFTRTHGLPTLIQGPRLGVADDLSITYYQCTTGNRCGQIASVVNAAGHTYTFDTYDAHGRVTRVTQPSGSVLTYTYDSRGGLKTIVESAGGLQRTTQYDYYANGLLQRVTDPTGAYAEYRYNDAHLLTEIRDNGGNRIEYGYDLAGNRTTETMRDQDGVVVSTRDFTYDAFNRSDSITLPNPDGGQDVWDYDYDATGLLRSVRSPEGRAASYDTYDALGRLVSFVNAESERVEYAYDAHNNIVAVDAPGGGNASYIYDDFGRRVREISADRGGLASEYDQADNLVANVDGRGRRTEYSYDALNRITGVAVESQDGLSTETLTVAYDQTAVARGRVTTATALNGALSYSYEYDAFGRLVQEELAYAALPPVVTQYEHDLADRLTGLARGTATEPSLWVTSVGRDAAGRITIIEDDRGPAPVAIVANVVHAPFGPYASMDFGNGKQVQRTLDRRYRVSSSQVPTVHGQTLSWSPDDNLEGATDWSYYSAWDLTVTDQRSFARDFGDRIIRLSNLNQRIDYAYDLNGNLTNWSVTDNATQQVVETAAYSYEPGSNKLAQVDAAAVWGASSDIVTSDASGNTLSSGLLSREYQYDSLSQLRIVADSVGGGVVGRYDFNHLGERVRKEIYDGGETEITLFTYSPDNKLIGETVFKNNVLAAQRDYVWMDSTPVAMQAANFDATGSISEEETYYLHADYLDTPLRATNEAGTEVWEWRESQSTYGGGFASILNGGPIVPINLRLPGQYYDAETTLNYNYYRHYWPQTGRYEQHDPIGLDGGMNPYLYANGNPVVSIDPTGEQAIRPAPRPPRPRPPGQSLREQPARQSPLRARSETAASYAARTRLEQLTRGEHRYTDLVEALSNLPDPSGTKIPDFDRAMTVEELEALLEERLRELPPSADPELLELIFLVPPRPDPFAPGVCTRADPVRAEMRAVY